MAKTQTESTLPAHRMMLGHGIYEEEVAEAHEAQNYAYGYNPKVHVCLMTGEAGQVSSNSIASHQAEFPNSTSFGDPVYRFRIYIDPDVVSLAISATCFFAASTSGEVRITIGSTNDTLVFAAGTNSDSGTLNTSSTGTGIRSCTVEIRQTGGTQPDGNFIRLLTIEDNEITSSLPDPPDE